MPKGVVAIRVENGWVTMRGCVEWRFQREAAERVLRGLTGVVGIQNEITTKAHPIEQDVTAEIDAALHRSRFDPRTITVTAEGGRVTLNGTVPTLADRHVACQTAWKARGATEVENNLVVA